MFQTNILEKIETYFMSNNVFSKSAIFLGNMEKYCRAGKTTDDKWLMRIACWLHKATNTQSEYVIVITFPLQR
jgi:hypothetical protein